MNIYFYTLEQKDDMLLKFTVNLDELFMSLSSVMSNRYGLVDSVDSNESEHMVLSGLHNSMSLILSSISVSSSIARRIGLQFCLCAGQ